VAVSPYERDRSFRENEIDGAVLPRLTHENLKELGVAALGHRLKLLDAIAALRGDSTLLSTASLTVSTALSAPWNLDTPSSSRRIVMKGYK
jgi:SAM domain (Sterile alpha motif)